MFRIAQDHTTLTIATIQLYYAQYAKKLSVCLDYLIFYIFQNEQIECNALNLSFLFL